MPPNDAVPGLSNEAARQSLLRRFEALALAAGAQILHYYASADIATSAKADGSPVTQADDAAERVILDGLRDLDLGLPIVAEEAMAKSGAPRVDDGPFILVDPLDGTREFLSRNGEFTVNIALIEDGLPTLGIVHAPALGQRYGGALGLEAWHRQGDGEARAIAARSVPAAGAVIVASRSHGDPKRIDAWLGDRPIAGRKTIGSSLKFCLIAAGEADIYPRFGRTMEWDTAAGHAVLLAAGGRVDTAEGTPLRYGKPGFENPDFIAWGADDRPG